MFFFLLESSWIGGICIVYLNQKTISPVSSEYLTFLFLPFRSNIENVEFKNMFFFLYLKLVTRQVSMETDQLFP